MAKVFLVNPQIANTSWGSGYNPVNMDEALPRHSLTHLSAVLKQAGHEVHLADLRLMSGWEQYEQILNRGRPDIVCVTAHTIEAEAALECFARAKRTLPDCMTIAGGIHFTMFPETAIKRINIDYVIRGEGEITLPRLIANSSQIEPVVWGEPPDLDQLPFEDRGLYTDYVSRINFPLWELPRPIVDLLTSRGCPWSCRFCCGPGEKNLFTKASMNNRQKRIPNIRRRSVDHVMGELKGLYETYGFRGLIFHDDQFLVKADWVLEFCDRMHKDGHVRRGVRWWAASRADMICRYPEAVKAMKDSGLMVISVGFESFKDDMLVWLNKRVDRATNLKAAELCHKLGLDIYANVIFGIPRADGRWYIEDDLESLQAMERIHPRYFSPSFFNPIPGSWFFEWAVAMGLLNERALPSSGSRSLDQCWIKGVDYQRLGALVTQLQSKLNNTWRRRLKYCSRKIQSIGMLWERDRF